MAEGFRPRPIFTARVAIDTYRPHGLVRRIPSAVMDEPTGDGACRTSRAPRPARAATSALTTTIACSVPVFLVGGLAVQIGDELHFSPAGLGLAVSVYFGVSALASVPAGGLVERYGATAVARAAIGLAAAQPADRRDRWPVR